MIKNQKFNFIICILLIFTSTSFSQTKTVKSKKNNPFDLSNYKAEPKDRLLLEFIHCGWNNLPKGVQTDWFSRGANFQLFFDHPLGTSNFSLAYGCGISSHNVSGNMNVYTIHDSLGGGINLIARDQPYKKNIFGAKIIEVPAEIRFRTRKARSFKISLGFKVGYTVQNFNKIFDADGKRKLFDIEGFNPIRYGPTIRLGFEEVYIAGFYSLSPTFNKGGKRTEIFPYTIGIGITPW